MSKPNYQAFTVTYEGFARELKTECYVSQYFDPAKVDASTVQHNRFAAIWDTGATGTVVTQAVVDACKLRQIGVTKTIGVNAVSQSPVYLLNLVLPNRVGLHGIKATLGRMVGTNVLIGMDVIRSGDMSVTNANNKTVFSFRLPAQRHIDFVAKHRQEMAKSGKASTSPKKSRSRKSK